MAYFPLFTDENVPGPVIKALRQRGWTVTRVVDVFGEKSGDDVILSHAAQEGLTLVSTDEDHLAVGRRWQEAGRAFRLVWWEQGPHQRLRPQSFVAAFEALAQKENAFASSIEYLKLA